MNEYLSSENHKLKHFRKYFDARASRVNVDSARTLRCAPSGSATPGHHRQALSPRAGMRGGRGRTLLPLAAAVLLAGYAMLQVFVGGDELPVEPRHEVERILVSANLESRAETS